jgi:phosphoribosylformylglycinamidine synthase
MWPAKLEGEGAAIFDAVQGLHDVLVQLGVAIDGGKDSLSMAAKVTHPDNTTEMVKAPGTLVLSTNCSVPDITKKITPDIKAAGESKVIFVNLSDKQR